MKPLRDNIEGIILTGTELISMVCQLTPWFDLSANTETEIKQHCKSFVRFILLMQVSHGMTKRRDY